MNRVEGLGMNKKDYLDIGGALGMAESLVAIFWRGGASCAACRGRRVLLVAKPALSYQ